MWRGISTAAGVLTLACLGGVTAPGRADPPAQSDLQKALSAAWEDLAGSDAKKAYRAIWAFVQSPEQGIAFLQARLKAVPATATAAVARLLADLDSKTFAVRDKATRELEQLAELAAPALRQALIGDVTLEKKQRLEKLLARLPRPLVSQEQLRELRSVEALELIGTDGARRLLQRLAEGAAEARLTVEARQSLARLTMRQRPAASPTPIPKVDAFGDPLPAGAVARLGTLRRRDLGQFVILPDNRTLATSGIGAPRLYDAIQGRYLTGTPEQAEPVSWDPPIVSPDGRLLAAYQADGRAVGLWELATLKPLHKIPIPREKDVSSTKNAALAFSADATRIHDSTDRTARLWDLKTGNEIRRFDHGGAADDDKHVLGISPLGNYLVRQESREVFAVWDTDGGKLLYERQHAERVYRGLGVAFSRDGKCLATWGAVHNVVRLWDLASGRPLRDLEFPGGCVDSVDFSPHDRQVAVGGEAETILIWATHDKGAAPRHLRAPGYEGGRIRYSPDGKTLAWQRRGGVLVLTDPASGKERHPLDAHDLVGHVAYSPDGAVLATAGETDREVTVRLWDAAAGKHLRTLACGQGTSMLAAFSPDGRLLATGSAENGVAVWETATGARKQTLGRNLLDTRAAWSRDGTRLATTDSAGSIRIWDVATGKEVRRLREESASFTTPWFLPDGKHLAALNEIHYGSSASLYDLATGREIKSIELGAGSSAMAFSHDGRTLAAADKEGITLWESLTGRERARSAAVKVVRGTIAFSPDGRLLAAGFCNHERRYKQEPLRVWDVGTWQELGPFDGHGKGVNAVALSPDGRRLATASDDTTVLIWDLDYFRQP